MSLSAIEGKLRNNSHVKRLLHAFKTQENLQLNVDSIQAEVVNLHASRPVKTLTYKSASERAVIEANLADQRTRSRLTELLSQVYGVSTELQTQLDLTKELLYLKYRQTFSEYRHRTDKERVLNVLVFNELSVYLERLAAVRDQILRVMEDIDQASFTLQRHVNIVVHRSQQRNRERSLG